MSFDREECAFQGSTPINERLIEIKVANEQRRSQKQVVIIGAGIAGLVAAYELMNLGHKVQILEASRRIGGRIWTPQFRDGQHAEFGAMRIPASHDYTRYYIDLLGLDMGRFYNADPNAYYDIRGVVTRVKRARERLYPKFKLSPEDRAAADENDAGAGGVYSRYLNRVMNSLSVSGKNAFFEMGEFNSGNSWPTIPLDTKSTRQYLSEEANEETEALEFIGLLTAMNDLWDGTLSGSIQGAAEGRGTGLREIKGGMEELPRGIADELRKRDENVIATGKVVTGIDVEKQRVHLSIQGEDKPRSCDYVLCTIPYSVMQKRNIRLSGVSREKLNAIGKLTYASSTKVLLSCKERFWERGDDPIYGGVSVSQHISKQTYYPSDHHPFYDRPWEEGDFPDKEIDLHAATRMPDLFLSKVLREHVKELQRSKRVLEPGVLLGSYTWGETAREIGNLPPEKRIETVIESIRRFHPETSQYVDKEDSKSMFWDSYEWAAGAFAHPQPGEIQELFPAAMWPEKDRLFFAGEHLSPQPGWIQGALVSSLRAVLEIVEAR